MNPEQKIIDSKIAAEDLIRDLEKVVDRANAALIHDRRARDIDAESPELFQLQVAIVQTSQMASTSIAALLKVAGMKPLTRLSPFPPDPFATQSSR